MCSLVLDEPQNGQRPLDHVRVADGPLVGLPGAHRPAGHERERLDPERGHEPVLLLDLVVESDVREARGVVRRRRVGRRAREPVAQHVRDDDEVLGRIQGHAVSDQPLVVPVAAGVPGRVHDRVALVGVQLAVCLVRELGVAQRRAVLQRHIAEIEDLVVLRELIHRNGTSSSWKAPASASSARPIPDGLSVTPVYPKCLDTSDANEYGWVLFVTRCIRSRRSPCGPAREVVRQPAAAVAIGARRSAAVAISSHSVPCWPARLPQPSGGRRWSTCAACSISRPHSAHGLSDPRTCRAVRRLSDPRSSCTRP